MVGNNYLKCVEIPTFSKIIYTIDQQLLDYIFIWVGNERE